MDSWKLKFVYYLFLIIIENVIINIALHNNHSAWKYYGTLVFSLRAQ